MLPPHHGVMPSSHRECSYSLPSGLQPCAAGPVISQLTVSQGWSHHLVWFKAKLPEWDGRAELFFLAPLPPFSPAQQKKMGKEKRARMWNNSVCVCAGEPLLPASAFADVQALVVQH